MVNDPILSVAVLGAVLVLQQSLHTVQAAAGALSAFAPSLRRSHINQNGALFRQQAQHLSWCRFSSRLTEKQFRRYFRMSKVNFDLLCEKLEVIVGADEFKSKRYLDEVLSPLDGDGGFKKYF